MGDYEILYRILYQQRFAPITNDPFRSERATAEDLLAWAISNRRMTIRIAIVPSYYGSSIYHEKIGVVQFPNGNFLAIEGSANESGNAYCHNYERIVVHDSDKSHYANMIFQQFESLWKNETSGVEVLSLHEAFQRRLLLPTENSQQTVGTESKRKTPMSENVVPELLQLPPRLKLRDYQIEAIAAWFANGGNGIFSMATGSGKTVTALALVESLSRRVAPPLVIIIVAPYLNLVDQWIEECKKFGLQPINCSGASAVWTELVETAMYLNQSGQRPYLSLVVTNTTFMLAAFQRVIEKLETRTIFIADEVHNLGARHLSRMLPQKISLRLGLSATPRRWMDEDGSHAIDDYFGSVVFNFDLADALQHDPPALCPYDYIPILVPLEPSEKEEYLVLTKQLSRLLVSAKLDDLSDPALALLLKRARLLACARQKLPALRKAIEPYSQSRFNLVYCGDGRVEIESSENVLSQVTETRVMRQVDQIVAMLGTDLGMNVAKYTADTSRENRRIILDEFANGDKQALVAMKCLDEGVDIPQVRRAFILASSTNPRQFIQRRGRVLRQAEGKDAAEIFDFVVVPPLDEITPGSPEYSTMRNLVSKEMSRVVEFARLARNGPQATGKLRSILSRLQLMHL